MTHDIMNGFSFVADPDPKLCDDMIFKHHYSHRPSRVVVYRAGLNNAVGDLVATVSFTASSTRWSQPVRELSRLVRLPDTRPPLTMLISKACSELRKRGLADLVVSFADSTRGHHGGVYQAASWNYHETRKPQNDGFIINGVFTPRRSCFGRYGTSSRSNLLTFCRFMGMTCEEHWDKGKHLYWRALTPKGQGQAMSLGLKSTHYVKNNIDHVPEWLK